MNLDPTLAIATHPGPSPELLQARAALAAQLAGLGLALGRLERLRAVAPGVQPGADWRGAAQSAYRGGVLELCRQLDEAIEAVRAAKRSTSRALTVLASRA